MTITFDIIEMQRIKNDINATWMHERENLSVLYFFIVYLQMILSERV